VIGETQLIGWLCMMRLQWDKKKTCFLPTAVTAGLVARGWMEQPSKEPDWDGDHTVTLTDAGVAVIDLNAPDWGINTIPEPAEEDGR